MCSVFWTERHSKMTEKITAMEEHLATNMDRIKQTPHPRSLCVGQDVFALYEGEFFRYAIKDTGKRDRQTDRQKDIKTDRQTRLQKQKDRK